MEEMSQKEVDKNYFNDFQIIKSFNEDDELFPFEIVLGIGERYIKCNKEFLMKNSDYFKAMFDGNFVEKGQKLIQIKDIEFEGFYLLLNLLRNENYFVSDNFNLNVLQVACILQFINIQKICLDKLTQILKPDNCLPIWFKCEEYSLEPLNLKAKRMALEEFKIIKFTESLLTLNFHQLIYYLSDTFLNCDNELEVFHAAQSWWYENVEGKEDYSLTDQNKILKTFLLCLDFKLLKVNEIAEIVVQPNFKEDTELNRLLNCCLAVVKNESVDDYSETELKFVDKLLHSKDRCIEKVPCFLTEGEVAQNEFKKIKMDESSDGINVIFFDRHAKKFRHLIDIDKKKYRNDMKGYQVIAYKELIFFYGGQILTSSNGWNLNLWAYDTNKEKWERKTVLPFKRRHFQTAICGDLLFIVGGTGPFRVIQDNLLYYRYKENLWSEKPITLPPCARPFKCCNFNENLLILDSSNKVVYIFNSSTKLFDFVKIKNERNEFTISTDFTLFSYKNQLYVNSGCQRFVLQLTEDPIAMEIVKIINVPSKIDTDCDQMETVVCGKFAYTLYVSLQAGDYSLQLEEFNLDTQEAKMISNGSWETSAVHLPCFAFFHFESVRNSVYVNDFTDLL